MIQKRSYTFTNFPFDRKQVKRLEDSMTVSFIENLPQRNKFVRRMINLQILFTVLGDMFRTARAPEDARNIAYRSHWLDYEVYKRWLDEVSY